MNNSSAFKFGAFFTFLLLFGQFFFVTNIFAEDFLSLTPQYELQYNPEFDHNFPESTDIQLLISGKINQFNQYIDLADVNGNLSVLQIDLTS